MRDKPLHICLVTNEFPGLTETFITTKALELSKRGHRITVIKSQNNAATLNSSHVMQVKDAGIQVLSYNDLSTARALIKAILSNPTAFFKSFSFSINSFKKKFKRQSQKLLFKNSSFDIVHFEFSGLALVYCGAFKYINAKLVVSCRGTAEKVKPITEPNRKAQLTDLFQRVDAVHCVSEDMAGTVKNYLANDVKMFVNRPSVDPNVFKRSRPYANTHLTIQLLTIGRFTFQKGYLIGLMAMELLKQQGYSFIWKIVGDGVLKEELLYHIHALGLEDCVELVGKKNRDEILELYNEVDVFLLTSVYEGIANVCLEAMSMELPVVSTKSGGMEEVIVHWQNGLLCDVYNPSSIASNIILLHSKFELRKQIGIKARETILERFTIERQADVFEEQYAKLLND